MPNASQCPKMPKNMFLRTRCAQRVWSGIPYQTIPNHTKPYQCTKCNQMHQMQRDALDAPVATRCNQMQLNAPYASRCNQMKAYVTRRNHLQTIVTNVNRYNWMQPDANKLKQMQTDATYATIFTA